MTHSDSKALRALVEEMRAALTGCQSVLSNLINPAGVSGVSIKTAYAQCVTAEIAARNVISRVGAAEASLSASSPEEGWTVYGIENPLERVLSWAEPIAGDNRNEEEAKEEIASVEALRLAMAQTTALSSAVSELRRILADLKTFDGDRRGMWQAAHDAEQKIIEAALALPQPQHKSLEEDNG